MIRIGEGFDVHRLVADRRLVLCGVEVPSELGLLGHSDADVALHALMDALLGSLALGDIGMHFPDSAKEYAGCDSAVLLKRVLSLPEFAKREVVNCDVTIIAQRPKLSPYRDAMRQRLSEVMNLPLDRISVKFTTTEHLGYTGRGEGIASRAVVLVSEK